MTAPPLSELTQALCFFSILLIPLAAAGLAFINTGLGRARSAAHMMLAALSVFSVAALAYFGCGFVWQGTVGGASHSFLWAGKEWSWLGAGQFLLWGIGSSSDSASLTAWLGMLSVGLAAVIPLGSGTGRWRLGACCASTALLAGWIYPLFAHWVWGGGCLAQLGINSGLGHGFIDAGGTSSIQAVGGLSALSTGWILGPRRSKFSFEGVPTAIPGHNIVLALIGCFLAWIGWLGLNLAGSVLYAGATFAAAPRIAINTSLSAAAAALAALVITRARFRKPDASLSVNGWIGGLVASSAACAFVRPAAAVFIGLVAGAIVTWAVEWVEAYLGLDDPSGAVSVHAIAGMWGVLAVGLFATVTRPIPNVAAPLSGAAAAGQGQGLAQLIGVATLIGFIFPMIYGLNWLLNLFYPMRIPPEAEQQGLDLSELGADAYPEFLTRTEDYTLR